MNEASEIGLEQGAVELRPYNPAWQRLYAEEECRLREAIGQFVADIQHVGSTAIPGIEAKPIIDMLVALKSLGDFDEALEPLEQLGYELKEESGQPGRFFFAKGEPARRTHYLYLVEWNNFECRKLLGFRDYLRGHPDIAKEYAGLKRELARLYPDDRDSYTFGKNGFIRSVLLRAEIEL
jgi:GrpB-like predicted nucleotidyltransferase (UPF0157 family)